MNATGIIIAAPASGSGKTLVTLGLLSHLTQAGRRVVSAKAGPDYIDPAFHAAATGRDCRNLDIWAMRARTLEAAVSELGKDAEIIVCEGVMGLFDGAASGTGSTADLACLSGWPVVLVVDARAQAASAAAVVRGFASHQAGVEIAGVIFNRVGGEAHRAILGQAMAQSDLGIPVLGFLPRDETLSLPSRHLGLVQAAEHPDLGRFIAAAAAMIAREVDIAALLALARPWQAPGHEDTTPETVPALGKRIAIARDEAFAFAYLLTIDGWRGRGAEISFFSPLADQAPGPGADAVYLPGGYPELQAARLAGNREFLGGLAAARDRGAVIFGECGGFMVLGQGLTDGEGERHAMAGLLALETSFAAPALHLGYRQVRLTADCALGSAGTVYRGHEFHYAKVLGGSGGSLFEVADARGRDLGPAGLIDGKVLGSFIHLIDREKT